MFFKIDVFCENFQWDPNETASLNTFVGHTELVYNAMWSPLIPSCFASVSGITIDRFIKTISKIWEY